MMSRWNSYRRNGLPTLGPSGILPCRSIHLTLACPRHPSVSRPFLTGSIFAALASIRGCSRARSQRALHSSFHIGGGDASSTSTGDAMLVVGKLRLAVVAEL